jgi:hypothetical protein
MVQFPFDIFLRKAVNNPFDLSTVSAPSSGKPKPLGANLLAWARFARLWNNCGFRKAEQRFLLLFLEKEEYH